MTVMLGIETSCDETAAAVVTGDRCILSNIIRSQLEEHRPFGGVVPEIAARSHIDALDAIIAGAMRGACIGFRDLTGVAVTAGPGLIGGLIVGVMTAKAIASVHGIPFFAVNHLEGHALTPRLVENVEFPFLLLLVSGGHCQLLSVEEVGKYRRLGSTLDDALGEAFDKTARLLGLPYPGGPEIERLAMQGDSKRFVFPKPLLGKEGCDFSFSGLKTAVRRIVQSLEKNGPLTLRDIMDVAASFQHTAEVIVADRVRHAIALYVLQHSGERRLVVAGGVAANRCLRRMLEEVAAEYGFTFFAPPPALCTDNAAMIAWAGIERLKSGQSDSLDFNPCARWPLAVKC